MSSHPGAPDDTLYLALEALQCSPDEIASALGIETQSLWTLYGSEDRIPRHLLHRLAALLRERATLLHDLSVLIGRGTTVRTLSIVS